MHMCVNIGAHAYFTSSVLPNKTVFPSHLSNAAIDVSIAFSGIPRLVSTKSHQAVAARISVRAVCCNMQILDSLCSLLWTQCSTALPPSRRGLLCSACVHTFAPLLAVETKLWCVIWKTVSCYDFLCMLKWPFFNGFLKGRNHMKLYCEL